ncbi:MAG: hypothetical protein JWO82_1142 [Akkermansiaceae bacterium]|nr:hypothetical protein [Akkermansiaceae bacterium]
MIQCNPQGICSSNYYLNGEGHDGSVELHWTGESGSLMVDGRHFRVLKEGFFSPTWTLYLDAQAIYGARRISLFSRKMEIDGANGRATLFPDSVFGRTMRLIGGGSDCLIRPAHAFTRRATIEGHWQEFAHVAFGFWLTALIWCRRQRSANGGGS